MTHCSFKIVSVASLTHVKAIMHLVGRVNVRRRLEVFQNVVCLRDPRLGPDKMFVLCHSLISKRSFSPILVRTFCSALNVFRAVLLFLHNKSDVFHLFCVLLQ